MASTIKLKSSGVPSSTPEPDDLIHGELALNYSSGTLFFKNINDEVKTIVGRNFDTQPVNLDTEVVGVLAKANLPMNESSEITLSNSENLFKDIETVEGALNYLFISANNIKQRIINVIGNPLNIDDSTEVLVDKITDIKNKLSNNLTFKGITTTPEDDFNSMSDKVRNIVTHSITGTFERSGIIVIPGAGSFTIPLIGTIDPADFCASLIEYIDGEKDLVFIDFKFDDVGRSVFSANPQVIFTNGQATINSLYVYPMTVDETWDDGGELLVLDGSLFSPLEITNSLIFME